jgi:hypothetical protein
VTSAGAAYYIAAAQQYGNHNPTPPLGTPDGTLPVTGLDLAGLLVAVLLLVVSGVVAYWYASRRDR